MENPLRFFIFLFYFYSTVFFSTSKKLQPYFRDYFQFLHFVLFIQLNIKIFMNIYIKIKGEKMKIIICYDIKDNKLRYRLVKYLERIGIRIQLSVFKADLKYREIIKLKNFANELLKNEKSGSILIFNIQTEFFKSKELPDKFIIL